MALLAGSRGGSGVFNRIALARWAFPRRSAAISLIIKENKSRYIGTDKDHMYLLVQSVPKMSPTEIVRTVKSITAKEVFRECPEVKKKLRGGEFWSDYM